MWHCGSLVNDKINTPGKDKINARPDNATTRIFVKKKSTRSQLYKNKNCKN